MTADVQKNRNLKKLRYELREIVSRLFVNRALNRQQMCHLSHVSNQTEAYTLTQTTTVSESPFKLLSLSN